MGRKLYFSDSKFIARMAEKASVMQRASVRVGTASSQQHAAADARVPQAWACAVSMLRILKHLLLPQQLTKTPEHTLLLHPQHYSSRASWIASLLICFVSEQPAPTRTTARPLSAQGLAPSGCAAERRRRSDHARVGRQPSAGRSVAPARRMSSSCSCSSCLTPLCHKHNVRASTQWMFAESDPTARRQDAAGSSA